MTPTRDPLKRDNDLCTIAQARGLAEGYAKAAANGAEARTLHALRDGLDTRLGEVATEFVELRLRAENIAVELGRLKQLVAEYTTWRGRLRRWRRVVVNYLRREPSTLD